MKGIVGLSLVSVFTIAFAQYPYSRAPEAPPQHGYSSRPSHRATNYAAPQIELLTPQTPLVPPQTPQRSVHQAAPVHYVNIGPQLQGDYKFGYDTGKGDDGQSFREETRLSDGTVQGSYGYFDASGKQRIVKYTAGKEGFKVIGDVDPVDTHSKPAPEAYPTSARTAARQTQNLRQNYPPQPVQPEVYAPEYAPPAYQERSRPAARDYPEQESYSVPLLQTWDKRPEYDVQSVPSQYQDLPDTRGARRRGVVYRDADNEISEGDSGAVAFDTSLFSYNIGASQ